MNKVLVVGNKGKVGSSMYELLRGVEDFQVWGIDKNELEVVKEVKKVSKIKKIKPEPRIEAKKQKVEKGLRRIFRRKAF